MAEGKGLKLEQLGWLYGRRQEPRNCILKCSVNQVIQ